MHNFSLGGPIELNFLQQKDNEKVHIRFTHFVDFDIFLKKIKQIRKINFSSFEVSARFSINMLDFL